MCRVHVLVHSVAFSCEAALVAVTLVKLMTEAQDPRFNSGNADAVRQYRMNVGVTAVSFAFTAVAFAGTIADVGALLTLVRSAARRISQASARARSSAKSDAPPTDSPDAPGSLLTTSTNPAASDEAGGSRPEDVATRADVEAHPDPTHTETHTSVSTAVVPLILDAAWDPSGVSTATKHTACLQTSVMSLHA